jgi:hypothetical protein
MTGRRVAKSWILALLVGAWVAPGTADEGPRQLPPEVPPVIVAWFWQQPEFTADGYRVFLDLMAEHSGANVLATSLRAPQKEVTDAGVREQIRKAASYARSRGLGIAMDLDVRLAREAFRAAYPDELQEMLRLRTVTLNQAGTVTVRVASSDLSDHYTGRTTHYIPLSGRLLRAYSFQLDNQGIRSDSVRDITQSRCQVRVASKHEVVVDIDCDPDLVGYSVAVAVSFTHLTPAVFAPHLMSFQQEIIESYADVDLVGVCKDEWGFPPCFDGCPDKNDYWYSKYRAEAYAQQTGGRDLVRDCLLMTYGEPGREAERWAAINRWLEMSRLRNGALEEAFYQTTKSVFGPKAIVATHPTWYPYPGKREFKKNGLDWWIATRDLAQTDEVTPYCARTSLTKKWGSGVWYNMFYASTVEDYLFEPWAHALGGGRIDYHPVYPGPGSLHDRYKSLLQAGIMRGDCRVRLLNFISDSPLDCPVAVIFGHACAMNWAGPAYDDVGISVTDGCWRAGFPADLIPSTEIGCDQLSISEDGFVQYGPQKYSAVVLYHPEFEDSDTAEFFQRASAGKTWLGRIGQWTRNFSGRPLDGDQLLPKDVHQFSDAETAVAAVLKELRRRAVPAQTPATRTMTAFGRQSSAPAATGFCRLLDGTIVHVAGSQDPTGDRIQQSFELSGQQVTLDAVGLAAVRLDDDGELQALAAGGLHRFSTDHTEIQLPQRADVALWRDASGTLRGVLQGWQGPVPEPLRRLTPHWLRLALPRPFPVSEQ